MSETVRVEVEVPGNVYEALRLIGEACHLSVEALLRWGARGQAEAFVHGPSDAYTEHFIEPLVEKVKALIEAETASNPFFVSYF